MSGYDGHTGPTQSPVASGIKSVRSSYNQVPFNAEETTLKEDLAMFNPKVLTSSVADSYLQPLAANFNTDDKVMASSASRGEVQDVEVPPTSPGLAEIRPWFRLAPTPPPFVPSSSSPSPDPGESDLDLVSELESRKVRLRRRKKERKRIHRPSSGDSVLISYLDPIRPDIAQEAGGITLDSASQSSTEDEGQGGIGRSPELEPFSFAPLSPNPFSRQGRLLDLPLIIANLEQSTIPDTGATINAVSYAALEKLCPRPVITLEDDVDISKACKGADGRPIDALGEVELDCSFPEHPQEVQSAVFKVFDILAEGVHVIMGKDFLEATQTLTKFASRLIERSRLPVIPPRVMHLTPSMTHMRVYLDSIQAYARADTGSELDLVSPEYVQACGFKVLKLDEEDDKYAQLADGRIVPLLAKIRVRIDVLPNPTYIKTGKKPARVPVPRAIKERAMETARDFQADLKDHTRDQIREFYVLKDLTCSILFGQALLDSMDAFAAYQHAFTDIDTSLFRPDFYGIFKVGKKRKRRGSPGTVRELVEELHRLDQDELFRRGKISTELHRKGVEEAQEVDPVRKAEIKAQLQDLEADNVQRISQYETRRANQLSLINSLEKKGNRP